MLHHVKVLGFYFIQDCIDGVMINVLTSSVEDCQFNLWLGQTKDYKIGICCISANHAALISKRKDWWAGKSEWRACLLADGCFSELTSTIKIITSSKFNLFLPWFPWKTAHLALNNNHSPLLSLSFLHIILFHSADYWINIKNYLVYSCQSIKFPWYDFKQFLFVEYLFIMRIVHILIYFIF